MKRVVRIFALAWAIMLIAACAQAPQRDAISSVEVAPTLYDRLGGGETIGTLISDFADRLSRDPILRERFEGANLENFTNQVTLQVIEAAGGPERYRGMDMREVHRGMEITAEEYDAMLGVLVASLNSHNIPSQERQELLNFFRQLESEIVTPGPTVAERFDVVEGLLARLEERLDGLNHQLQKVAAAAKRPLPPARSPQPTLTLPPPKSEPPVTPPDWSEREKRFAEQLVERYDNASKADGGGKRRDLLDRPLRQTRFLAESGRIIDLADYQGRPVVMVIMRGFAGQFCLHCSTQLVALAKNIDEFRRRGVQLFIVYPGNANTVPAFIEGIKQLQAGFKPPFEILLDVDLAAVRSFLIEGSLAKPTTMVLDSQGVVRWAYVGRQPADRPSVETIIEAVERI